jgi:hypothetical protein
MPARARALESEKLHLEREKLALERSVRDLTSNTVLLQSNLDSAEAQRKRMEMQMALANEEGDLAKERQLEDYSAAGWPCRKCGAAVRAAPRQWSCRSAEPVDWWWCFACKQAHAAKDAPKTPTQKKLALAAQGCRRLDVAWFGAGAGAAGGSA